ncbi:MAG: tetratricopeptide repeat protein [Gammaproteobacteria bacterium]|nr:tetratricopeptide repeat protein [Gammaproteobacteria bacterium]
MPVNSALRIRFLAAAAVASCWSMQAVALNFEYSSDRPDELRDCDALEYRGERYDADDCYAALRVSGSDPRVRAEAAWSLGDLRAANTQFQEAIDLYPEDPRLRTRWGELFVMTHQDNEAVKLFQEALELDPDYAPAKLGLASVSAGRFEDQAREWVDEALGHDQDQLRAHLLLARMSLETGELDDAEASLDRALRLAEAQDLPPLEVYALKASADLLRGVTDSVWTTRALEMNASFGDIYAIPAHFYVITRRYREAIELLSEAVRIQPDLWAAHAELGVNLLRVNRIAEAMAHLETAYRGDPFSAKIVNTLRLIDSLDNFRDVVRMPEMDEANGGAGMILRLHRDESEVLEPYVSELVNDSLRTFSQRYGFELSEPVVVELYPEHDDFAVRTSGLPGIGLLGVTFGYLVAMDSPSGRTDNDFHWGTTLWHEMAHVFTLEATNHLVPRWFSEGVSVYEEWSTGPLPGRHIPMHVLQAVAEDKFLAVADLDSGFIRPTYDGQVMVSYMQAGLICQFIEHRWGQSAFVAMLEQYTQGADTAAAIEQALGISPDAFDQGFEAFIAAELGGVLESLDDWKAQSERAYEAADRGDWGAALEAASAAVTSVPEYVADGNAYLLKAKAHDELEQPDEALATLESYWSLGGHDAGALKALARRLDERGRRADAIDVLDDLLGVVPLDSGLHIDLGDRLMAEERATEALREYRAVLALNPYDQAGAHYRLATAYRQLDDAAKTREHLLYALEIAPHYREAQQLLLEIAR